MADGDGELALGAKEALDDPVDEGAALCSTTNPVDELLVVMELGAFWYEAEPVDESEGPVMLDGEVEVGIF